jgi:putative ABC transport system permease protein
MGGIKKECVITGIFKDVPVNSSENFDFILSFDDLKEIMGMGPNWNSEPFVTYLTVKEGTDISRFNSKLTNYIQRKSDDKTRNFFLKPFSDNYLYSKYENGKEAGGRIDYVNLFSLIALFILLISCINFMNLSTAKSTKRAKEIGIKKVIGVGRRGLIVQYLGEFLLMSFLSLLVAVIIVTVLLPQFNEITEKSLHFHFDTTICWALLSITIITGLLSGSYLALYLSAFKPVVVLNNRISFNG